MDGLPLGVPGTWADFLRQQATLPRRQRGRGQGARRKSARATAAKGGYAALADGLVFRVLAPPGALRSRDGVGAAQAAAVEETFRLAFLSTWRGIPTPDRQSLLTY